MGLFSKLKKVVHTFDKQGLKDVTLAGMGAPPTGRVSGMDQSAWGGLGSILMGKKGETWGRELSKFATASVPGTKGYKSLRKGIRGYMKPEKPSVNMPDAGQSILSQMISQRRRGAGSSLLSPRLSRDPLGF